VRIKKINIPENSVRKNTFDVMSVLDGWVLDNFTMLHQLEQLLAPNNASG
jgi:hypothetical protein